MVKKVSKKRGIKEKKINNKIRIIVKNLIGFGILFIFFLSLYYVREEVYKDLFFILSIVFGIISLTFLISLLVYVFVKYLKK